MIQVIVTGTIKAAEVKIPPCSLQLVVLCWSPTYGLGSDSESFISAKEKNQAFRTLYQPQFQLCAQLLQICQHWIRFTCFLNKVK